MTAIDITAGAFSRIFPFFCPKTSLVETCSDQYFSTVGGSIQIAGSLRATLDFGLSHSGNYLLIVML